MTYPALRLAISIGIVNTSLSRRITFGQRKLFHASMKVITAAAAKVDLMVGT